MVWVQNQTNNNHCQGDFFILLRQTHTLLVLHSLSFYTLEALYDNHCGDGGNQQEQYLIERKRININKIGIEMLRPKE